MSLGVGRLRLWVGRCARLSACAGRYLIGVIMSVINGGHVEWLCVDCTCAELRGVGEALAHSTEWETDWNQAEWEKARGSVVFHVAHDIYSEDGTRERSGWSCGGCGVRVAGARFRFVAVPGALGDVDPFGPTLWEDDGGRVVCSGHLGHYGVTALASNPVADRLQTPIADWVRYGVGRALDWVEIVGGNGCESCRSGWMS